MTKTVKEKRLQHEFVVVVPFDIFKKGDRITDEKIIANIEKSDSIGNVVRVTTIKKLKKEV